MRSARILCIVLFALIAIGVPGRAVAQDGEDAFRAALLAGTCSDRGDRIARLDSPAAPTGAAEGASAGEPALVSETTVDVPFDDLLDGEAVLVLTREGASGVVACGAVGGPVTADGRLVVQVAAVGDAGVWGVAVVAPSADDPDRTDVTLYLVGEDLGGTPATAGQAPSGRDQPVGGDDEPAEGDEPNDEASPDAGTYVSPTYGYALTYDPALWQVVEEPSTEDGFDRIALGTTGSSVYFGGIPTDLDAPACVGAWVALIEQSPDVAGSARLEDGGEEVRGGDADDAFGAYVLTVTEDDGSAGEQNAYVRCIVLEPGRSALVITHYWQFVDYATAAARLEKLLAGLKLP